MENLPMTLDPARPRSLAWGRIDPAGGEASMDRAPLLVGYPAGVFVVVGLADAGGATWRRI